MLKGSAVILDAIRRSFLTNQQQQRCLPQFESILDGHLSLPSRNREYHLKKFDRFRASFPQTFCTNNSVSVADRLALKAKFYGISLFISAIHDVQRKLTLQDKL